MATHKFAVGQALHFSPGLGEESKSKGHYKVVRQLPETGNMSPCCMDRADWRRELGGVGRRLLP
jgi:hypothetical protein